MKQCNDLSMEAYAQLREISVRYLFTSIIGAIRTEAARTNSFAYSGHNGEGYLLLQMTPVSPWAEEWIDQLGASDVANMRNGGTIYKISHGAVWHEEQIREQIYRDGQTSEVAILLDDTEFMTIKTGAIGGSYAANKAAAIAGTAKAREYFCNAAAGKVVLSNPKLKFSDSAIAN